MRWPFTDELLWQCEIFALEHITGMALAFVLSLLLYMSIVWKDRWGHLRPLVGRLLGRTIANDAHDPHDKTDMFNEIQSVNAAKLKVSARSISLMSLVFHTPIMLFIGCFAATAYLSGTSFIKDRKMCYETHRLRSLKSRSASSDTLSQATFTAQKNLPVRVVTGVYSGTLEDEDGSLRYVTLRLCKDRAEFEPRYVYRLRHTLWSREGTVEVSTMPGSIILGDGLIFQIVQESQDDVSLVTLDGTGKLHLRTTGELCNEK